MKRLLPLVLLAACGGAPKSEVAQPEVATPAPVETAAEQLLGTDVTYEHEDEGYEAHASTEIEVTFADDGAIKGTEVAVPVATLPSLVRAAVSGTPTEASVILADGGVTFEVEVDGTDYLVDASGKVLGQEHEAGDDNDD